LEIFKNIKFTCYESGHVIYLSESALAKLRDHVRGRHDEAGQ
jgi:hypothetical protein